MAAYPEDRRRLFLFLPPTVAASPLLPGACFPPGWMRWATPRSLVASPWPQLAEAARPAPTPLPLFCARVGWKKTSGRRELTERMDPVAPPVSDLGG